MYDRETLKKIVDYLLAKQGNKPLVVGLAGPQGSGKSTLSLQIQSLIQDSGIPAAVICLDDFYHTKATRVELSRSVHPMLLTRGPPGSHDVEKLIEAIGKVKENNDTFTWPIFNKAMDDREPNKVMTFKPTPNSPPIILLEGWCVGCLPTAIEPPLNELEAKEDSSAIWRTYVNEQIKTRYTSLWKMLDVYMYITIPDWGFVMQWRHQQSISNQETSLDLNRFIQFFERISRSMMEPTGRIPTDVLICMAPDHSIDHVTLR